MLLKLHRYLVYYNFFISCCSIALLFYFSLVLHKNIEAPVYIFTFSSTLFVYNLFRHYQSVKEFLSSYRTPLFVITTYAFVISIACFTLLPKSLQLAYGILGVLTLFYKFPLVGNVSLRALPYIKIVVIAVVWVLSALISFMKAPGLKPDPGSAGIYILMQFLFFISICIPFDIFDMHRDTMSTIPQKIGAKRAILVSYLGMVFYLVLAFLLPCGPIQKGGYFLMTMCTCFVLRYSKALKHKYSRYYLIDGLIILQTGIVFLCQYHDQIVEL
ncbi:MAG: hypothetical protein JST26_01395 [Bacteroidetes bacterium]|nr:hypothetical protein [Bacteroidota bacterium]